jgi:hypothetical protein
MNVAGFIQRKKEEFMQKKTQQLKATKEVEARKAKLNAEYMKQKRDVDNIKAYNAKVDNARPNAVRTFANNLAKHINTNRSTEQKSTSPFMQERRNIFYDNNNGQSNGPFGQSNNNKQSPGPFSYGNNNKQTKGPFSYGNNNKQTKGPFSYGSNTKPVKKRESSKGITIVIKK